MHDRKIRNMERWFGLLTALMGGARPTAHDLAKKFGVTERTIFRDVAALEEMQIPVVRTDGRYSLMDTYRLKPVQFTPDEVVALAGALDFARRRRSLAGKAAASAMDKLLAVMPLPHQAMVAGLDETLVVDPLQAHSLPGLPGVEQALTAAIQGGHPVRIEHISPGAETQTERVIRPYGMAYRGTALYLIGYCELRQGLRTFRLNRIRSVAVLPAVFTRPADFDLERYVSDIWSIEDGPLMHVRVRFSKPVAELARETQWHPTQTITEEPDGCVVLQLQTRGTNELARWVAGYGGTVEVLEPADLRDAVRALGQAILQRYPSAEG
ncbi:MAG: GntR family transcriptional regulator [Firmicutes bacterium]|nr:GntR family transcriptional regulator [Bacillota bacterium]